MSFEERGVNSSAKGTPRDLEFYEVKQKKKTKNLHFLLEEFPF